MGIKQLIEEFEAEQTIVGKATKRDNIIKVEAQINGSQDEIFAVMKSILSSMAEQNDMQFTEMLAEFTLDTLKSEETDERF